MSRWQIWLLASRPKTLAAAVGPVAMGWAMAHGGGMFHLPSAAAALTAAVLIQVMTNFINDYSDFATGVDGSDRVGPMRVTQAGLVTPGEMKNAILLLLGMLLVLGAYLVYRGGWPILLIGLLSLIFAYLYSAGPAPLSHLGIADLFVLIFFGPVAVAGTYYVQALSWDPAPVLAGLAPGLFSVAILTVNNLRDLESDRQSGKRTLAVRLGVQGARFQYAVCLIVASLIPVAVIFGLDCYEESRSLAACATLVFAAPVIRQVLEAKGPVLNHSLAATGRLLLIFSGLFSLGWIL